MTLKKAFKTIRYILTLNLTLLIVSCGELNNNQLIDKVNNEVEEYFQSSKKLPKIDSTQRNCISNYIIGELLLNNEKEIILEKFDKNDQGFKIFLNKLIEKHSFPTAFASRITTINDTSKLKWFNDEFHCYWYPRPEDYRKIENIIKKALNENISDYWLILDETSAKYYGRQYLFFENNEGDSMVFINAFCEILDFPTDSSGILELKPYNWRNNFMIVDDGGDCFWKIKINLSQKKYLYFIVNGVG
jgi:hypothetical protein